MVLPPKPNKWQTHRSVAPSLPDRQRGTEDSLSRRENICKTRQQRTCPLAFPSIPPSGPGFSRSRRRRPAKGPHRKFDLAAPRRLQIHSASSFMIGFLWLLFSKNSTSRTASRSSSSTPRASFAPELARLPALAIHRHIESVPETAFSARVRHPKSRGGSPRAENAPPAPRATPSSGLLIPRARPKNLKCDFNRDTGWAALMRGL